MAYIWLSLGIDCEQFSTGCVPASKQLPLEAMCPPNACYLNRKAKEGMGKPLLFCS